MPDSKTILCLDTISSASGIYLIHEGFVHHAPLNPQMASEGILPLIDEVFQKSNADLADLSGVMVIQGPGSFTGLRVGISVANQFAHQLKIPIVGLRTDEWWRLRTAEKSLYLQSMNKAEVYVADEDVHQIIPLEELPEFGKQSWLGQLKFDHAEKLPADFVEIIDLHSPETTWLKAAQIFDEAFSESKIYELIEPFYGKAPNITPSKKRY